MDVVVLFACICAEIMYNSDRDLHNKIFVDHLNRDQRAHHIQITIMLKQ